jgi:uncharacterized membrane protein YagU involved in acid resistance
MTTLTAGRSRRTLASIAILARGAIGGLATGLVFAGATMWFVTSVGMPARTPLLMISTLVKGSGAMINGTANASLGLIIHMVLSMAFGVGFAVLAARLPSNGSLVLAGLGYGGLLYLLNFQILARAAFHVFSGANQPFEVVLHLVFGVLLALAFFNAGPRRGERFRPARSSGRPLTDAH